MNEAIFKLTFLGQAQKCLSQLFKLVFRVCAVSKDKTDHIRTGLQVFCPDKALIRSVFKFSNLCFQFISFSTFTSVFKARIRLSNTPLFFRSLPFFRNCQSWRSDANEFITASFRLKKKELAAGNGTVKILILIGMQKFMPSANHRPVTISVW